MAPKVRGTCRALVGPRWIGTLLLLVLAILMQGSGLSAASPALSSTPLPPLALGNLTASVTSSGAPRWQNESSALGPLPPARCCGSMAYDAASQEEVLFGGLSTACAPCNQTWVLRDRSWAALPGPEPPARAWASLAYDPAAAGLLLFGGEALNGTALGDTWTFNGSGWTELSLPLGPVARWSAAMAWAPGSGAVVLFGGFNPTGGFLADTWSFSGGRWSLLHPTASPSARWGATMVSDPRDGYALLFGGFSSTQGFLGDTWSFANGTWTSRTGTLAPPPREKGALAFDPNLGAVVLFGGDLCPLGCLSGSPTEYLSDTWTYAQGIWTNSTVSGSPTPRCCSMISYDGALGRMLLFSGTSLRTTSIPDLWAYIPESPALAPVGLWVVPRSLPLGGTFTAAVGVTGLQGEASYQFSGLPPGVTGGNVSTLAGTPTAEGSYIISVEVQDLGTGASVEMNGTLVVGPALPVLQLPTWGTNSSVGGVVGGMMAAAAGIVLLQRRRPGGLPSPPGHAG